jgi:hypothetical protein
MTSVNMIFFLGGPCADKLTNSLCYLRRQLGEVEAGIVAALFGAPIAIFAGGIATILLTGWLAWKYPRLRDYNQ